MELYKYDAVTISNMVNGGETSSAEVAQSYLDRIDTINPRLNALTVINRDAPAITHTTGTLAGVPFTSKINIDHRGYPTDNGMEMFRHNISSHTSPVLQGLEAEGATMMGRTNSPPFAFRIHTSNTLHGDTENPFDKRTTPGGSSGGAAVAVATGMCVIGVGNDVGGSIRWPAFCNGLVGLRPTIGRMPVLKSDSDKARLIFSMLMSTNGPITRTVDDMWMAFKAMSVPHPDPLYSPVQLTGFKDLPKRVAIVNEDGLFMDEYAKLALDKAAGYLSDAGYQVEHVVPLMLSLTSTFDMWDQIVSTELDPKENDLRSYINILTQRDIISRSILEFLEEYPIILTITNGKHSMIPDYDLKGKAATADINEQMRYLSGTSTLPFPVLQVPIYVDLPRPNGVQLIGPLYREDILYEAAKIIEENEGKRQVIDIFDVL